MINLQHSKSMIYDSSIMKSTSGQTGILRGDRIRKISGSFAFIEHRFLRDGFFESLNFHERLLYLFLVLVSDRNGMSWYSYDRICAITGFTLEQYIEARNSLVSKDLIDFDGRIFQVLSLPEQPIIKKDISDKSPEMLQLRDRIENLFKRIP